MVLRAFKLRPASGGAGKWRGGDGVVRELQFRQPSTVSILSERRAFRPYGLASGKPGLRGVNTLLRADGGVVSLGGKNTVDVTAGDRLRIESPGGGGYGAPVVVGNLSGDSDDDEYALALARATGAAPATEPSSDGESLVTANESSGAAAAFLFSGSVGRYKETQETA